MQATQYFQLSAAFQPRGAAVAFQITLLSNNWIFRSRHGMTQMLGGRKLKHFKFFSG
jgi:hypothetical protein